MTEFTNRECEMRVAKISFSVPFLFFTLLASIAPVSSAHADSNALWKIVHGKCTADIRDHGLPAPCAVVSDKGRYAILKDRDGATQFLLIPTDKVTGIEDPAILKPDAPNYFDEAWANRHFVEDRLHKKLPREDIALAINSAYGRSQNQLHIHIDCVRPDVAAALKAHEGEIGLFPDKTITLVLAGHSYRVGRIVGDSLARSNPFALIAAAGTMAAQTIVVTGAHFRDGRDGFYLLNDHAGLLPPDHASGEELEDHSCAIAG